MNNSAAFQGSVLPDRPISLKSTSYVESNKRDSNETNLLLSNLNSMHELPPADNWLSPTSAWVNTVPTVDSQTINLPNLITGIAEGFIKTCQKWNLNSEQQKTLLGLSPSDPFGDFVLCGTLSFMSRDFEDRIGYVIRISIGLQILFRGNREAEINWLNCKRKSLDESTPIAYMLNGHMTDIIEISHLVDRERGF